MAKWNEVLRIRRALAIGPVRGAGIYAGILDRRFGL